MKLDQLWVAGDGVGAHAPACSNGASHGSGTSSGMHPKDGDSKHVIAPFPASLLLQWEIRCRHETHTGGDELRALRWDSSQESSVKLQHLRESMRPDGFVRGRRPRSISNWGLRGVLLLTHGHAAFDLFDMKSI
ncbi:hypothetical protein GW17_00028352 [Ensete ventricosum]|nr:hypothetical protein GW17_00028352 [Ensete ventricosum]